MREGMSRLVHSLGQYEKLAGADDLSLLIRSDYCFRESTTHPEHHITLPKSLRHQEWSAIV